jgi:hypothetical protein
MVQISHAAFPAPGADWRTFPLDGSVLWFHPGSGINVRWDAPDTRTLRRKAPRVVLFGITNRCNLACAGCGKIQYPAHILKRQLTPEECFKAVDECGAPMVSIPGGEPLLHPQIAEIVEGLVARMKREIGRPVQVVATGGLATLFDHHTELFDAIEPDLTIQGLAMLYERSRNA